MTTERSGMSLSDGDMALAAIPSVYWERVRELFNEIGIRKGRLSRDAVVSAPLSDAECRKFANALFGPGASDSWIPTLRAALSSFAAGHACNYPETPEGWVLAPVEPTAAMRLAANKATMGHRLPRSAIDAVYKAMLAQRDGGSHG